MFTVIAISFGKHALFVLNPIYVDAYPVVIILSIGGFLVVIINLFKQMLTAVETVDLNEKSTKSEYLKSKLFTVYTAQNIASAITLILLVIGLVVLSKINATDLIYPYRIRYQAARLRISSRALSLDAAYVLHAVSQNILL